MDRYPRDHHVARFSALAAATLVLGACAPQGRMVQGECRTMNGAQICSWGRMSGNTLVAFGATVPVAVAQNAPAEMPMQWPPKADAVITLPREVQTATGFDHMDVFWEPHGHPPGAYLHPHFDFHFYTVTTAAVDSIDCKDSAKPAALPASYAMTDVTIPQLGTLVGLCVPAMGMHSLPGADLQAGAEFQKTMIVGYYHTQPIFIEPMITQATLTGRQTFGLTIPAVAGFPAGVKLPTGFQAEYDSTAGAYHFTFSGFPGTGTN